MKRMIQHWAAYLFPPRCVLCGDRGQFQARRGVLDLCLPCQHELPRLPSSCGMCARPTPSPVAACGRCLKQPPAFDYVHCVFLYEAPVHWMIGRFKFNRQLVYGRVLAQLIKDDWPDTALPDMIVPVPLHRERLRQRGFNQALELFRPLAQSLGIPIENRLCVRARPTSAQSGLDKQARRSNVRGAFKVKANCSGKHVVIVDDVVTTGSTVGEMARVLKQAGAIRVGVWAVARTVNHLDM